MGLVRRLAAAISRLLETHFLTLFHAASALSAPSGHLPLEGKADDTGSTISYNGGENRHHKLKAGVSGAG